MPSSDADSTVRKIGSKRPQTRRFHHLSFSGQPAKLPVHDRVDDFPNRHGHQRGYEDGHGCRHQPAAERIGPEPGQGLHPVALQQGKGGHEKDHCRDCSAQHRIIAVRALLQAWIAGGELGRDPEGAVESSEHQDAHQTRHDQHAAGDEEQMPDAQVAVAHLCGPDHP